MDWIVFTKIGKSYFIQNGKKYIYFIKGVSPAVYWYDDRLEIISYGTIPSGMAKEDFLSGKTHPVNEELMKIFLQCHIVEQTGLGVLKVVRKYGAQAYDFGTSTIIVTIPFDRSGFEKEDVPVNVPVNVPVKQTNEDKIVEAIKMNSHVTMNEMARIIGKTRKTLL